MYPYGFFGGPFGAGLGFGLGFGIGSLIFRPIASVFTPRPFGFYSSYFW
ncbi:MAG TPA: hypothetical protein GX690_01590 [Tenericutes bacterium]|jgi:hypothetical protein|nr:hypothetical protein [Mycoplasmatota bacterium]